MILDEETGEYRADIDWVSFYKLTEGQLSQMIGDKMLMTDEEARDTGLLQSKYLHFMLAPFLDLFSI